MLRLLLSCSWAPRFEIRWIVTSDLSRRTVLTVTLELIYPLSAIAPGLEY